MFISSQQINNSNISKFTDANICKPYCISILKERNTSVNNIVLPLRHQVLNI